MTRCQLCGVKGFYQRRHTPTGQIQRHHLVPADDRGPKRGKTIRACKKCHRNIHRRFSNKQLAAKHNTLGLLREALDAATPNTEMDKTDD